MELDLAFVWAGLIAFAVLAYVVLDGFDLGIGILFPLYRRGKERDLAMNTVAPVWDGNETWLVLGGGGLMAAFPLAYAIILPALYAPMIAMLLALIFRGVAFEYRWKTKRGVPWWDAAFFWGSFVATFAQGITLGALVQGIAVEGRAYSGGWWDWLTPFSLMTGAALVLGYSMLGAGWLIWKTEGPVQDKAFSHARLAAIGTVGLIGVVSLWTPFLDPKFMERWFAFPQNLYVVPVPLMVAASAWFLWTGLRRRYDRQPFVAGLALFVLSYVGLGISLYPEIVPPDITIWDAAAPDSSLAFLLVGAAILIPVILVYTAHAYWVFRGKTDSDAGYH
jgi:cytochrome d ubiquinol oxidase subunit II